MSIDAARRQAFGAKFDVSRRDQTLADQLLGGRLTLSPHPEWALTKDLEWTEDPFSDRNWRAQLQMLRWMDPLRRRADAGDAASATAWLHYAKSWIDSNLSPAKSVREAWMDMVDGLRALELCIALPFVSDFEPTALEWLIPAIQVHAEWLMDERNLGHSNHALHQHQGLFVCGAVLRNEEMMQIAECRMLDLFKSQYDSQGINAEGAIAYHMANAHWWAAARHRLELEERPVGEAFNLLDAAAVALAHATKPDGALVSIGDTDGGNARVINHSATKWVTTAGADGEPPTDTVRLYDAGYLFARSGWGEQERDFKDETFLSVSFGSPKRVHGHRDGMSMTFSSMGHEWITDPGKFQYGSSPMRDYCLSRASHSLPYLLDMENDDSSIVECVSHKFTSSVYEATFVDRGYRDARITRRVIYSVSGEYAIVIDHIDSEIECTAVQNWQCGKETTAVATPSGFQLSAPAGGHAAVLFTGTRPNMSIVSGQESPIAGWVATGWKKREMAPALQFTKVGKRFRFITLIAAGAKGKVPTMETVRHDVPGLLRLRVDTGRVSEQIVIERAESSITGFYADEVESSTLNGSDEELLNPLDKAARVNAFENIENAFKQAWESDEESIRLNEAERLRGIRDRYETNNGVDLGLSAAIADLSCLTQQQISSQGLVRARPGLLTWTVDRSVRSGISETPVVSLRGANSELPALTVDTLVSYSLGSIVLPALVSPAPGSTLTVMFHGAVDRAKTTLPLFQRLRFQKTLNAGPTVCFSDPTLDLSSDLRLGWYLGTERVALANEIATATKMLVKSLGCTDVVFQGGSGGGFAALQVGARYPGSHVVAQNPQTDVREYIKTHARNALIAAYGDPEIGEQHQFLDRIDVMYALRTLDPNMSVTLVMNKGDVFHETKHAAPLRHVVTDLPGVSIDNINLDLGPGHKGLSNEQYVDVMKRVYAKIDAKHV
ncbi:heparinase II/III domain-containing protein [Glutamicibacter ardleyensis]|uniref:heparinase II/III domain-containing protein n=1 Tax=Glutamicibacter ardleyensis TaxID=225894 RepID=UPI003FD366D2